MKNKFVLIFLTLLILTSCVGTGSKGVFGTGVSIALDPRSLGTQIDDSIMQKNLATRLTLLNKNYFLSVNVKILDGRIFLTGKVNNPEEKLQITKLTLQDKNYFLSINAKVLDGRIFLTGKVDNPEKKLQITKSAWETAGVRSVRNDIKIKEVFNLKISAKDLLITSQLRASIIFNKKIKAANYSIDTYKKKNLCVWNSSG